MRSLCLLPLGLLLASGCADSADNYEVNKPVITEPVPHVPADQADDTDVDLDADLDADDNDTLDGNTANPNSAAPGAADNTPTTSGAIENDAAPADQNGPVAP